MSNQVKDNEQREIKFRAWDEHRQVMVHEFADRGWGKKYRLLHTEEGRLFCGNYMDNGDWQEPKLMQFTGLLDKNGKEIYEGDILNGRNGIKKIVEFDKKLAAFVYIEQFSEPHKVSFAQMYNKFKSVFYKDGKLPNHEIIGNIYSSEPIVK